MKQIKLSMRIIFMTLLLTTFGYSQSIERQVIGSAGSTLTDGATVSMDFTVGELAVTTITDGITTLTQGFHQGMIQLSINLSAVAYLQGAALNPNTSEETLMRDDLRVANLIPTTSPYSDGLTCNTSVFTTTGANAIVDWIFVELRDATNNTIVITSQSALLQRDGDVVDIDGVSALSFNQAAGNYYVALKHRNHLGIMSNNAINLGVTPTVVDYTNANSQITFGTNAQTSSGMPSGIVGMWAGDVNGDNVIQYSGTNPDSPSILSEVLNDSGNFLNFPTYVVNGYNIHDINMDGKTQYSGTTPDTPYILQNIFSHSGNFLNFSTFQILEQLP